MAISKREEKYHEDQGAAQYYRGQKNDNPHREGAFISTGDAIFGAILGPNSRMQREDAHDRGYRNAKNGK